MMKLRIFFARKGWFRLALTLLVLKLLAFLFILGLANAVSGPVWGHVDYCRELPEALECLLWETLFFLPAWWLWRQLYSGTGKKKRYGVLALIILLSYNIALFKASSAVGGYLRYDDRPCYDRPRIRAPQQPS